MSVLIASDDDQMAQQARALLARDGTDCPNGHVVSLEMAAERISRLGPELLILVLPDDPAAGLRALRDVSHTVDQIHILVIGPADDPKLILKVLHEGGDEYLDSGMLQAELSDALVRYKAREKKRAERAPRKSGRVISVLGPSGGCGSSTLVANIGAAMAKQHGECGLVDLRLAAGDLAAMLDLNPVYTLTDMCDRLERVDQSMFDQFFVEHSTGIRLLAAPREFSHIARVTDKAVRHLLTMARMRFPYVVVDLDNAYTSPQVEALWRSDVILLVLRLDYTSVRNTRRVLDNIEQIGIGLDRVLVVANAYRQRRQLHFKQAEEALGVKIVHYVPNDPASVNRSINKGVPVVLYYPSSKVSQSIVDLAYCLNGHHESSLTKG